MEVIASGLEVMLNKRLSHYEMCGLTV